MLLFCLNRRSFWRNWGRRRQRRRWCRDRGSGTAELIRTAAATPAAAVLRSAAAAAAGVPPPAGSATFRRRIRGGILFRSRFWLQRRSLVQRHRVRCKFYQHEHEAAAATSAATAIAPATAAAAWVHPLPAAVRFSSGAARPWWPWGASRECLYYILLDWYSLTVIM